MHDEDAEVSSYLSEAPVNDAYNMPYTCDPYAAFDPDVSAISDDDNHESVEPGSAQRSFKKIGEQWGAMVADHGRSHRRSQYGEEKVGRRDVSSRQRSGGRWRRSAGVRSPSVPSPDLSVQHEAVSFSRTVHLVNEEVQTTAEDDAEPPSPVVTENNVVPDADSLALDKEVVHCEVQCSPKTADLLRKEYIGLVLYFDFSWLIAMNMIMIWLILRFCVPLRIGPLHFQAGRRKKQLNLSYNLSWFILCFSFCVFDDLYLV